MLESGQSGCNDRMRTVARTSVFIRGLSVKKILLGIALILFGFMCVYVAVQGDYRGADIVGLFSGILGLVLAITGFFEKEK